MGALASMVQAVTSALSASQLAVSVNRLGTPYGAGAGSDYASYARAYKSNEIVYAAVKMISTSAAEPRIIGKRVRRERASIKAQTDAWRALGVTNRAGSMTLDRLLVANKFVEEVPLHPLVKILNNPNPLTSRGQLWSTIAMDRSLAGNAYLLKARGPMGNVQELWRMRPDRVRIIPDRVKTIGGYEYIVSPNQRQEFAAEDVMHFKEPDPLDDYYGMPPLLPAMGRVTIDGYMQGFLRKFFESGGTGPGSVLRLQSSRLSAEAKEEIAAGFKQSFGGPTGWHRMLVTDAEATYTPLGLQRGLRDALPKELDQLSEARIAMVFGIPGSILGLLIGYESSSYANKRQDWQVLWDVKMSPLMSDMDDVLNLGLTPEFAGVDEVMFDLSNIRALQEDEDALQERARKNVGAGLWSFEEGRVATGVDPFPTEGTFFVPSTVQAMPVDRIGEEPEPPPPPAPVVTVEPPEKDAETTAFLRAFPLVAIAAPVRVGRPSLAADPEARALFERGETMRRENPRMTLEQVSGLLGVSERTYRRYRDAFTS